MIGIVRYDLIIYVYFNVVQTAATLQSAILTGFAYLHIFVSGRQHDSHEVLENFTPKNLNTIMLLHFS